MATLLNKDFVVKAGLVVEGTGAVSSGTITTGSVQIAGGLQVGKNIIVQSTSSFRGTVEALGNVTFNSGLTVIGAITATNIFATINTASNLQGGAAQSIPIQSSTGTTTFIPIGQPYQFLTVSVAGTATWQNFSGAVVGYATTASNLLGGNAGQIPYQTAPGITQFITTGTAGQVLISNSGTSAPQFTNDLTNLGSVTADKLTVNSLAQITSATITTLTATFVSIANTLYVGSSTYIAGDLYVDGTQFTVNSDILSSGNKTLVLSTGSTLRRDFADGAGLLIGNTDPARAWSYLTYGYNSNSWQSNVGLYINTSTQSDATNTGALVILGGAGFGGNLNVGGTATVKNILINGTNNSTASTGVSGALMVAGGIGIAKDLYVGGTAYLNGSIPQISAGVGTFTSLVITGTNVALTVTNNAYIGNTLTVKTLIVTSTVSSLTNTTSNALYIAGGVGISGILNAGDIYSNGVKVALQASSVSSITGGTDTAVSTATGAVTIWNTSTLQSVTNRGSTTTNAISITSIAQTFGTNTGALTVTGGVGIGSNLNVGGYANINATSYIKSAEIVTTATINQFRAAFVSTTTSTLHIINITSSTNTLTGALIVDGGLAVGQDLNIGGNIRIGGAFAASKFIGNLSGIASTASTMLTTTVPDGNSTPYYLTFVQNNYAADTYPTPLGQPVYTSKNIQIETDTGYVNIGSGTPGNAQLSINSFNNANNQIVGLQVSGPDNNQYSPDINVFRFIRDTPNSNPYYGANIRLSSIGNVVPTNVVIQEYNGSLLFFSDGLGESVVNTLLLNSSNQLFVNYQDPNATGPGALNVTGSGYFTNVVTATTFSGSLTGIATTASSVVIVSTSSNAVYYPALTNQNSQVSTSTALYTTSTFSINPSSGGVGIGGNLTVGGTTSSFIGNVGIGTLTPSWRVDLNLGIIDGTSTATGGYNVIGDAGTAAGYTTYNMQLNNSRANAIGYMRLARTTGTAYLGMQIASQSRDGIAFLTGATTLVEQVRISATGTVTISTTTDATSTNSGALQVVGGVGIGGNLYVGGSITAVTTSYVGGAVIITSATLNSYLQGTGVTSIRAGTDTAVTTSSGLVIIWNTSTLQTITGRGATTTNAISITSTATSTGTNTGALTVAGGVGIGGSLYVANTSFVSGAQILTTATLPSFGVTGINVGTDTAITSSTGAITIWNTSTLQSITNRGATTTNVISITNTASSTGTNTGALTVAGGLGIGGNLWIGSTIASTSTTTTNALYIAGGLGVAKGINVGATSIINGDLRVTGNITGTNIVANVISGTSGVFYGDSTGNGALYAGVSSGYTYFPQTMIQASGNFNGYMEINVQNVNNGTQASTDIVASADNVGTSTSYIDMGITNSGWNGTQPYSFGTVLKANDGYLLVSPGNTTATGNLVIGTINTGTSIKFLVAATAAQSTLTTVTASSVAVVINPAGTNANSTSTGTLVVYGGVGITKDLFVGGVITATNIYVGNNPVLTAQTIGQYGVSNLNGSTGSVTIAAGTDTAINTTGTSITIWNTSTLQSVTNRGSTTSNAVSITNTTTSTGTNSGALIVMGGVGIAGNLYVGGTITANIVTIQYTTVTTTLVVTDDVISTYNSTASTGTTTGALTVTGGVGIGGTVYIGNTSYVAGAQILTTATLSLYGVTKLTAGTDTAISTSTGAVTIWDTSTLQSVTNRGSTTTNAISITSTATSTGTSTGALTVAGGVGIGDNLYVANTSYIAGAQILTTASIVNFGVTKLTAGTDTAISTSTGVITIWNTSTLQTITSRGSTTTNAISITSTATSTGTTTGALTVIGGVGIGGSLYVAKTSYVAGAQILTTDSIANFGVTSITAGTDTAISSSTGAITIWNTSTLQTITNRGLTTTNAISITSTATSTGTNTGALTVTGGVGIGGALYVANTSYVAGAQILTTSTLAGFFVAGTDTAISIASGIVTIWNTSTIQSITNRSTTTTNAISITNSTSSTNSTTGALTVAGGVGIGGTVYIGNQTTGTVNAVAYGSALLATVNISLNTTTQTIVDSFSTSTYRSAKYFCQITSGTTSVHLTELSVFYVNNTTYINEYGINTNNGVLGSYDATISNGNVNLLFTPNSSTTVVLKMTRDTILL